jgi:hypothetical protein
MGMCSSHGPNLVREDLSYSRSLDHCFPYSANAICSLMTSGSSENPLRFADRKRVIDN